MYAPKLTLSLLNHGVRNLGLYLPQMKRYANKLNLGYVVDEYDVKLSG